MDFEKFNDFWGHSPFAPSNSHHTRPLTILQNDTGSYRRLNSLASEIFRLSDIFRTSRRWLEYDCSSNTVLLQCSAWNFEFSETIQNFAFLGYRSGRNHKNYLDRTVKVFGLVPMENMIQIGSWLRLQLSVAFRSLTLSDWRSCHFRSLF